MFYRIQFSCSTGSWEKQKYVEQLIYDMCSCVCEKTVTFLGEKEHGVERDLLDHYKEKGGVQNSVFFGDAIFKWHRTKIFFFVKIS